MHRKNADIIATYLINTGSICRLQVKKDLLSTLRQWSRVFCLLRHDVNHLLKATQFMQYGHLTVLQTHNDKWHGHSISSRRHGSDVVLQTTKFSNGDSCVPVLFSRRRIVLKQRHCHIRQTICSTRFCVKVCLLVVWCKNFQPPPYSLPKFKIFDCKMRFFVKIAHLL